MKYTVLLLLLFTGCAYPTTEYQIVLSAKHASEDCFEAASKCVAKLRKLEYPKVTLCTGLLDIGEHAWVEYSMEGIRMVLDPFGNPMLCTRSEFINKVIIERVRVEYTITKSVP